MRIPITIHNTPYIRLSKIDSDKLFGKTYIFKAKKKLAQKYEYISEETVTLIQDDIRIETNIILPFSKQTQVHMPNFDGGLLMGPSGEVYIPRPKEIPTTIQLKIASEEAKTLGLRNNKKVNIKIVPAGEMLKDITIKVDDSFILDLEIDNELAQTFGVKPGSRGSILN